MCEQYYKASRVAVGFSETHTQTNIQIADRDEVIVPDRPRPCSQLYIRFRLSFSVVRVDAWRDVVRSCVCILSGELANLQ